MLPSELEPKSAHLTRQSAIRFVILMGIVSLFADMTYEGARSITGPYLALLGASGAVVGFVSGLGEFMGYGVRLIAGYVSDRTRSYWTITFIGYFINLLAVPLLALTNQWLPAVILIVLERIGRAIRSPSRDAMLSYATHTTGRGWGFGLHEALDQIGAVIGPLLMSAILAFRESYTLGFVVLLFPALTALVLLAVAHYFYPRPEELEKATAFPQSTGLQRTYWIYVGAVSLIAAGFVDFPLMAYHFEQTKVLSPVWIPIVYALAMGVDGLAALVLGKWFDYQGVIVLVFSTILSALAAPLVFWGNFTGIAIGMILWGIGMGAQESIMRAFVAHLVGMQRRATAFGVLNWWFGVFWFIGSAGMGYFYDYSLTLLVLFSMTLQLAALPLLWKLKKALKN